jgi:hypothetical protein
MSMQSHRFGAWRRAGLALIAGFALLSVPTAGQAQAPGPNLLDNPDFNWPEQKNPDVCSPGQEKPNAITPRAWTAYWACKSGDETQQDQVNREPEFKIMNGDLIDHRPRIRSYPTSASFFNFYSLNRSAGLVQTVRNVTPGTSLRFSIWAMMWSSNGDDLNSNYQPGGLQARVCIDTTGYTVSQPNFSASTIVCSPYSRQYDQYHQLVVEATATAPQVTVIFDTSADFPVKHNDVFVDDAELIATSSSGQAPAPVAPQAPAAPAAPPPAAPIANDTPSVSIKLAQANIRNGPSFAAQIVGTAQQNTQFAATAVTQDGEWFQIQYQSGNAFVHNSVVTPNAAAQAAVTRARGAAPAAPVVQPPAPTPAPAQPAQPPPPAPAQPANALETLPVINAPVATQAPAAPSAPAAPAAPAAPTTTASGPAQVTANTGRNRLLVRARPSATGAVIGRVATGTAFRVLGLSPDKKFWRVAYTSAPSGEAWVMVQWTLANASAQALLTP